MHANLRRLVFWGALAALIALGLTLAFRPQPVAVDTAEVARGTLVVTVEDEGRTRVHDIYTLSAPVTGRMRRIEVHVGDPVTKLETVLAEIEPIDPAFLDPRSEAQARADVRAAESAGRWPARRSSRRRPSSISRIARSIERARSRNRARSRSGTSIRPSAPTARAVRRFRPRRPRSIEAPISSSVPARSSSRRPNGSRTARSARASRCVHRSTGRCCNCCNRARASSKAARP